MALRIKMNMHTYLSAMAGPDFYRNRIATVGRESDRKVGVSLLIFSGISLSKIKGVPYPETVLRPSVGILRKPTQLPTASQRL